VDLYFDACALVPLFFPEASTLAIAAVANNTANNIHISALGSGEFASAFSRRLRMGEIAHSFAQERMTIFDQWATTDCVSVPINNTDIIRAVSLVRRFDLKLLMPDAIHAALCERHLLTLVTLDERLAEACGVMGVNVLLAEQ
jgi:uncharacterized protein